MALPSAVPRARAAARPAARRPVRPLAALAWLVAAAAVACASPPRTAVDTGRLFLWEIESPQPAAGSAHLLGSIHVGTGEHAYDPAITGAFEKADTVVMEVPPEDADPQRAARLLLERGRLEGGRTLRDVLPPDTWRRLEEVLAGQGLPLAGLATMKPWVLVLTLATRQFASAGYVPEEGVDRFFQTRAEGKRVLGLETIESQFDVFDSLPLALQVDALEGLLAQEQDDSVPSPDALVEAWARGDVDRLEEILFADLGEDPQLDAFYEAMYFRRNRDMARRIAALLERGEADLFVVVGAGHLVGERGIPALLARQGFRVERVRRTP